VGEEPPAELDEGPSVLAALVGQYVADRPPRRPVDGEHRRLKNRAAATAHRQGLTAAMGCKLAASHAVRCHTAPTP
jgi:hypothetical protein